MNLGVIPLLVVLVGFVVLSHLVWHVEAHTGSKSFDPENGCRFQDFVTTLYIIMCCMIMMVSFIESCGA